MEKFRQDILKWISLGTLFIAMVNCSNSGGGGSKGPNGQQEKDVKPFISGLQKTYSCNSMHVSPSGVVHAGAGASNQSIYKFDAEGKLTNINFLSGFRGSKVASGNGIDDMKVNSKGELYVAESFITSSRNRIHKFSTTGASLQSFDPNVNRLKSIALFPLGNGLGDKLFVLEQSVQRTQSIFNWVDHYVREFDSNGDSLGSFKLRGFPGQGPIIRSNADKIVYSPSGHVYVLDYIYERVEKFDSNGNFVLAFDVDSGVFFNFNLDFDTEGNIYTHNRTQVYKLNSDGGSPSSFSLEDNGRPINLALNSLNEVYVLDSTNHQVQKFNSEGSHLLSFGSQGEEDRQFEFQSDDEIKVSLAKEVFVFDKRHQRVQKFDSEGNHQLTFCQDPSPEETPSNLFSYPTGLGLNASGELYVLDSYNHRVQKYDSDGNYMHSFGSQGSENEHFDRPVDIAINASGELYVLDSNNHRVQKFDSEGDYMDSFGSYGSGNEQFDSPSGIAINAAGEVYVADTGNGVIKKFSADGDFLSRVGSYGSGNEQFDSPSGIAINADGEVYVADTGNHRVQIFDSSTDQFLGSIGLKGQDEGEFNFPGDVALSASGEIYVLDVGNHRIQKFDANGDHLISSGAFGSGRGQFQGVFGITLNARDEVLVTDYFNHRVLNFNRSLVPIEN